MRVTELLHAPETIRELQRSVSTLRSIVDQQDQHHEWLREQLATERARTAEAREIVDQLRDELEECDGTIATLQAALERKAEDQIPHNPEPGLTGMHSEVSRWKLRCAELTEENAALKAKLDKPRGSNGRYVARSAS